MLTCGSCGYSSARFEPFNILTLPIPDSAPSGANNSKNSTRVGSVDRAAAADQREQRVVPSAYESNVAEGISNDRDTGRDRHTTDGDVDSVVFRLITVHVMPRYGEYSTNKYLNTRSSLRRINILLTLNKHLVIKL